MNFTEAAQSSGQRDALELVRLEDRWGVVNKPAGLMVHDSGLARGERDFLADRLRDQLGRPIHLVHRLDRATSGCLLFAFDREAAAAFGQQFMSREVEKVYLAVCRGWPAEVEFDIDYPLDGGPGKPEKKSALTRVTVLAQAELDEPAAGFPTSRFALLECRPHTGRFRQIRRHLKHIDHHLMGDTSHGDGRRNRALRLRGIHRMLLHANRLVFRDPLDGKAVVVEARVDAQFEKMLALFGWTVPPADGG